jgi:hypothetical protein
MTGWTTARSLKIKAWHDRVFADMVIEQVQTVQEREAMK